MLLAYLPAATDEATLKLGNVFNAFAYQRDGQPQLGLYPDFETAKRMKKDSGRLLCRGLGRRVYAVMFL